MRVLIALALLCSCMALVPSASAEKETIPASVAAARYPVPSFAELHRQFTRVVRNESGWISRADGNGILKSLLFSSGGRDLSRPTKKGVGYGIDYTRLMLRMVKHSGRTFPRKSRFLSMISPGRIAHISRLRTYNNVWVSGLQLDCSEPDGWEEERSGSWLGYVKRCAELVEMTGDFLRGEMKNHCMGQPTTWGSESDSRRKGGPLDLGWKEIYCDWPGEFLVEVDGEEVTDCRSLREAAWQHRGEATRALINSRHCARNRFFDWRQIEDDTKQPSQLAMR